MLQYNPQTSMLLLSKQYHPQLQNLKYADLAPCLRSQERKKRKCSRSVVFDSLRPQDYTVHGILQATILEWVAVPFSRGSSHPEIEPRSPTLQVVSLLAEPLGKPKPDY